MPGNGGTVTVIWRSVGCADYYSRVVVFKWSKNNFHFPPVTDFRSVFPESRVSTTNRVFSREEK